MIEYIIIGGSALKLHADVEYLSSENCLRWDGNYPVIRLDPKIEERVGLILHPLFAKSLIHQGANSTRGTQTAQRGQVNFQTTLSNNVN